LKFSDTVVNFASSLLCGVNYAQLPRQVQVDKKGLFNYYYIIRAYNSQL